jgi:hypothetical protein
MFLIFILVPPLTAIAPWAEVLGRVWFGVNEG